MRLEFFSDNKRKVSTVGVTHVPKAEERSCQGNWANRSLLLMKTWKRTNGIDQGFKCQTEFYTMGRWQLNFLVNRRITPVDTPLKTIWDATD